MHGDAFGSRQDNQRDLEFTNDSLPLSGLQHFQFCRRQWSLIYVEQQWSENYLTAAGRVMHERAHDAKCHEMRGNILTVRGLCVNSKRLGVHGVCDVVEYHRSAEGVHIATYDGLWLPFPVEYKHGSRKVDDCDRVQLCAQAMCLEEMHHCRVETGALYYGKEAHREVVPLSEQLRQLVLDTCVAMHDAYARGTCFPATWGNQCKSCSLVDMCLPRLRKNVKVCSYFRADLEDAE